MKETERRARNNSIPISQLTEEEKELRREIRRAYMNTYYKKNPDKYEKSLKSSKERKQMIKEEEILEEKEPKFVSKTRNCSYCKKEMQTTPQRRMLCESCFHRLME